MFAPPLFITLIASVETVPIKKIWTGYRVKKCARVEWSMVLHFGCNELNSSIQFTKMHRCTVRWRNFVSLCSIQNSSLVIILAYLVNYLLLYRLVGIRNNEKKKLQVTIHFVVSYLVYMAVWCFMFGVCMYVSTEAAVKNFVYIRSLFLLLNNRNVRMHVHMYMYVGDTWIV